MRVSVICTVLNEEASIRGLMEGLAAQTRRPDEVIVVDGGSRDRTVETVRAYAGRLPLQVIEVPDLNISQGRNLAIAAATGDIIASTDAGVWPEPDWLQQLVEPIAAGRANVVSGFFVPDPRTPFETALGATVLPTLEDVRADTFLPSSRSVAFRKTAWAAAGGYPEWLDYCEDLVFDMKLRAVASPFGWAPGAAVHFRPRSTPRSFFKQYYQYARGDGKADLWRLRHALRYAVYLIALPVIFVLGLRRGWGWLGLLLAGAAAYCRTPYRRLQRYLPELTPAERVQAIALVPVIRGMGDIAKMAGYPVGWVWRLRNRGRKEIHWR